MRPGLVAVAVCQAACGRLGFEPGVDTFALGPFGAPTPLDVVNTIDNEDDPALTGDLLELYFDSDRPGGLGLEDLYVSRRASTLDAWGPPAPVVELNSPLGDLSPGLSFDGRTIYFSRRNGGNDLDFFVSTRPDRTTPWGPPVLVPELSSPDEDTNAQLSADGLEIWFASLRDATTMRQLFVSRRSDLGQPFSTPLAVTELNVAGDIYTGDPWPSPDGKALYFASDRPGVIGGNDIWRVDRASPSTFGVPELVLGLNSSFADYDPCLSPDERFVVFASGRAAGNASDIYTASR